MVNLRKTHILYFLVLAGVLTSLISCGPTDKKNNPDAGNYLGKSDGGGGDDQKPRSSADQVIKSINKLKSSFLPENDEAAVGGIWDIAGITGGIALKRDIKNINTPALKDLITKMTAPASVGLKADRWDFAYLADLKNTHFEIREDHSCQDSHHGEKDASTKFQPESKICFSVPRLRLIPPLDLRSRLAALLMHELAHHFGADEETAVLLQNYYYDEILSNRAYLRFNTTFGFTRFEDFLEKLIISTETEDQKKTCEMYGKSHATPDNGWLRDIEASNGEISGKPSGFYKELGQKIHEEIQKPYWDVVRSYCKEDHSETKEKTSKEDLIESLQQLKERCNKFRPAILDVLPTAY